MIVHHCDRCGKEIAVDNRRTFTHRVLYSYCYFDFLYEPDSFNRTNKRTNKDYELCKDCTEKLIAFLESDKHE